MNTTDLLNLGVDPDDLLPDPTRCHGPAYPDAHGCGRFAQGGMCDRCAEESREYWRVDEARQREWDEAQIAKELELELAAHAAELAAHPPTTTACEWCGHVGECRWSAPGYICADRDMCERRLLAEHERNLGFQAEREWSREDLAF